VHSLYRSSTRGPEDDSVESKHADPLSHYMLNITTVVFDGPSPPFYTRINMNYMKIFSSRKSNDNIDGVNDAHLRS